MVKRQLVSYSYTCDVCGGTISDGDAATRRISWEGTAYVVDVCDNHGSMLGELLTQLKSFVDAGTRVSGRRGRRAAAVTAAPSRPARARGGASAGASPKRSDLSAVRAWARENGRAVSERGRIPGDLLAAYDAAHGTAAPAPAASAAEPAATEAPQSSEAPAAAATAAATRTPRGRRASASTAKAAKATKATKATKSAAKSTAKAAAKSGSARKRTDLGAVRAWARENGHTVNERGRLSSELLAAYEAANNGASTATTTAAPARKRRPRKVAAATTAS
jgi:hypothetical protein